MGAINEISRAAPEEWTAERIIADVMKELKIQFPDTPEEQLRAVVTQEVEKKLESTRNGRQYAELGKAPAHPLNNTELIDRVTNMLFGDGVLENGRKIPIHQSKRKGIVSLVVNEGHEKNAIYPEQEATTAALSEKARNYHTALLNLINTGASEITFLQLLRELNPALNVRDRGNDSVRKKHISKAEFKEIMDSVAALQVPIRIERDGRYYQGPLLNCAVYGTYVNEDGQGSLDAGGNGVIILSKGYKSPLLQYALEVKQLFDYPKSLLIPAGNKGIIHIGRYLLRRLRQMSMERQQLIDSKHNSNMYNRRILWEKIYSIDGGKHRNTKTKTRAAVIELLTEWKELNAPLWDNGARLVDFVIVKDGRKIHAVDLIIDN